MTRIRKMNSRWQPIGDSGFRGMVRCKAKLFQLTVGGRGSATFNARQARSLAKWLTERADEMEGTK